MPRPLGWTAAFLGGMYTASILALHGACTEALLLQPPGWLLYMLLPASPRSWLLLSCRSMRAAGLHVGRVDRPGPGLGRCVAAAAASRRGPLLSSLRYRPRGAGSAADTCGTPCVCSALHPQRHQDVGNAERSRPVLTLPAPGPAFAFPTLLTGLQRAVTQPPSMAGDCACYATGYIQRAAEMLRCDAGAPSTHARRRYASQSIQLHPITDSSATALRTGQQCQHPGSAFSASMLLGDHGAMHTRIQLVVQVVLQRAFVHVRTWHAREAVMEQTRPLVLKVLRQLHGQHCEPRTTRTL
jgi:hypothetical protein